VSLSVDPASAPYCSVSGSVVSLISNGKKKKKFICFFFKKKKIFSKGTCILYIDQGGNSNYFAAPTQTQTFDILPVPPVITYVPANLFGCLVDCTTVTAGLFQTQLSLESNQSAQVVLNQNQFKCAEDPFGNGSSWLSVCNLQFTLNIFTVNARRVENLQGLLTSAMAYNQSCTTSECTSTLGILISAYTPINIAAASSCSTPTCLAVVQGTKDELRDAIRSGVPGAYDQEKIRFDSTIQQEALQQLQLDTYNYAYAAMSRATRRDTVCNTDGCLAQLAAMVNRSFAINGYFFIFFYFITKLLFIVTFDYLNRYLFSARAIPFAIANETHVNELLAQLDSNFTRCTTAAVCTIPEASSVYRAKRAIFRYLVKWQERLNEINSANCTAPACDLQPRMSTLNSQMFLASDYFTVAIYAPGIVLYCLMLVAAVAVAVLGIVWSTVRGKELFWLVLVGIFITCVIRIAFWAVGAVGVGTTSLVFIILDKLGSLFFALTIFVFVYMWARAVLLLMDAAKSVTIILTVTVIAISCAIVVVSIYYAVYISRTFVTIFFAQYVVDNAEIVLAVFTVFLSMCLFVFIIIVGFWLKKYSHNS
jgi:hypothetical protein